MPYIGKSPSAGVRQRYQYTATAGQTTFTGTDLGNLTLTYTDNNFVDVFQNGVLLKGGGTDYTATSGTSVVLATGASVSDVIEIIVYDVFSVGNFFNRTDSDSRYVKHNSGTLGTDNFIAGNNAGDAITSGGNENTLVGNEAGTALTTGDANVAVGFEALSTEDAHGNNTAVGYRALKTLNAGAEGYNVAVGQDAGTAMTTGRFNNLIGSGAGDALTVGASNVAIGYNALSADTQGSNAVAIGDQALAAQNFTSATDSNNTAIGANAGTAVTTGVQNVLVGSQCGDAMTTGARNVAMGYGALGVNILGQRNVAIGYLALMSAQPTADAQGVESLNTAVGYEAGMDITTGVHNTFIGAGAADDVTTANRCTVIGYNNNTSTNTTYDEIVIGNNVNGNGNSSFTFGTGNSDSAIANGATSISAPSDQRYKENIETSTAGLGFINDLRPVTYKWKMEKDIPTDHKSYVKDSTTRVMNAKDDLYHGFIAQEVKTALDNHSEVKNYDDFWSENIDGRQRLAPAFLIPMLTKAIQELSAKNDALEARIKTLEDG